MGRRSPSPPAEPAAQSSAPEAGRAHLGGQLWMAGGGGRGAGRGAGGLAALGRWIHEEGEENDVAGEEGLVHGHHGVGLGAGRKGGDGGELAGKRELWQPKQLTFCL